MWCRCEMTLTCSLFGGDFIVPKIDPCFGWLGVGIGIRKCYHSKHQLHFLICLYISRESIMHRLATLTQSDRNRPTSVHCQMQSKKLQLFVSCSLKTAFYCCNVVDQSYVERDLMCLLNTGTVLVMSVPELKQQISCDVIDRDNLTSVRLFLFLT